MQTVTLRSTDLTVSRLCFGTMTFGGQTDEAAAARILDQCFGAGINFLDTANVYNKGASEEILGRLLKGRRNRVVLASKVRGSMGPGPDESGLSRKAILRAVDASLRRLQTDHLDLYYLHMPDYAVPVEETLAAMDELVKAGKVRWPASSNFAAWQVVRMLSLAERNGYRPAWVTQPMYNLLARGVEQEYLPMCREMGVSTAIYNPLAGGLLTGKQSREAPLAGTRFDNNQLYLDRYWHPAYFDAVSELREVAAKAGRSLVSLSLNWLLHHTSIDCVILGASRPEQLEENLAASKEGPLTPDTVAACDAVWAKLRGVTPKYNR
jgi:aryl-alcohol dehydrogenase-like predicted oxidoreductase